MRLESLSRLRWLMHVMFGPLTSSGPAPDYWPALLRGLPTHARLRYGEAGGFRAGGAEYVLPRLEFDGPETDYGPFVLGLFATIHGDEPAGTLALVDFLSELAGAPELAAGYKLVIYPVCNPTGLEAGTRENGAGFDLNREFWRGSTQPEVMILERELRRHRFDGIITLHSDDTSEGLYGFSQGGALNEFLLKPALAAAESHFERNRDARIDGFEAHDGIIRTCYQGVLAPPPGARPQPFEIIFETPGRAEVRAQARAAHAAVTAILTEYRKFISQAADI